MWWKSRDKSRWSILTMGNKEILPYYRNKEKLLCPNMEGKECLYFLAFTEQLCKIPIKYNILRE